MDLEVYKHWKWFQTDVCSSWVWRCIGMLSEVFHTNSSYEHAGSDPEVFWLQPVMASVQPELDRIIYHLYAWSNFPHPVQFHFSKEDMDHIYIYCTKPIWMACQGLMTRLVWNQAGVQESLGPVSGRMQPVHYTSFPLSDSVAINHRCPGWYYAKPTQIRFSSGWLCQVLAKQIRSRSKLVCKNHPAIASEPIQIRCELDPACLLSLLALPLQLQWLFTIWPCPGVVNLAHCPDITVRLAGHKTPTYLLTYHLPHLLLFLLNT